MGVSNVNNRNPVELVKLAMQKQAASAAAARKPDYMTMTGSIFNAPNARTTTNICFLRIFLFIERKDAAFFISNSAFCGAAKISSASQREL